MKTRNQIFRFSSLHSPQQPDRGIPVVSYWGNKNSVFLYSDYLSPSLFYLPVHSRCRGCLPSLDHTQTHTTVGKTPLDEGSARRRDLYLKTQTLIRSTAMPPIGFEPTISASARLQTYALDRVADISIIIKINDNTINSKFKRAAALFSRVSVIRLHELWICIIYIYRINRADERKDVPRFTANSFLSDFTSFKPRSFATVLNIKHT
jgi:hypothetical protein